MKLGEAEQYLRSRLETIYDANEASGIASLALEHLTGRSRTERIPARNEMLSAEQETRLADLEARLLRHEPIQYITGKAWFYGMELYVDGSVLIPRPETEELVDWIVKDVKTAGFDVFEKKSLKADETSLLKILDVGTGSGCIALALKNAMPRAEVWGCDTSEEALNIARRNGSQIDIRVDFQGVDFLHPAQQRSLPSVDIIVSNPPYIPHGDKDSMKENVLQYEPHLALFVPDNNPFLFYEAISVFADHRLHNGGSIYMEIHEDLATGVHEIFNKKGYDVELRKDMQGKDRMIKARK